MPSKPGHDYFYQPTGMDRAASVTRAIGHIIGFSLGKVATGIAMGAGIAIGLRLVGMILPG